MPPRLGWLLWCHVCQLKVGCPRPPILWQGPAVNLWQNCGRSGRAPWLTTILIQGLEGGRVGMKRGEGTWWMDTRVDFSVRSPKRLTVQALGFAAVCHSAIPTTAILFPCGLNLSKGILCISGLPLVTKDSRVMRERERGLNSCSETVLILTPLYLRQNNHCQTTAFPLPPPSPTRQVASGGWCVMPSINRKQHFHLPGKQAG